VPNAFQKALTFARKALTIFQKALTIFRKALTIFREAPRFEQKPVPVGSNGHSDVERQVLVS